MMLLFWITLRRMPLFRRPALHKRQIQIDRLPTPGEYPVVCVLPHIKMIREARRRAYSASHSSPILQIRRSNSSKPNRWLKYTPALIAI